MRLRDRDVTLLIYRIKPITFQFPIKKVDGQVEFQNIPKYNRGNNFKVKYELNEKKKKNMRAFRPERACYLLAESSPYFLLHIGKASERLNVFINLINMLLKSTFR